MAITSAKAITSATMLCVLHLKGNKICLHYGNNTNHTQIFEIIKENISHTPCGCSKIAGKTFSSDLRKPCLITGKSLSPPTKIGPVHEKSLAK